MTAQKGRCILHNMKTLLALLTLLSACNAHVSPEPIELSCSRVGLWRDASLPGECVGAEVYKCEYDTGAVRYRLTALTRSETTLTYWCDYATGEKDGEACTVAAADRRATCGEPF